VIGFSRDNKENVLNLFDWNDSEVKDLEKLTAASESRNTKAVSIDLKENISSNSGCEWQLKYFGK
jgi:hypothetical protein